MRTTTKAYFFEIENLNNKQKLKQSASAIALNAVKLAVSKTFGISFNDVSIIKGENGKPYIKGFPNFHFNISHSLIGIALAFSDRPVGIDIEKLRTADLRVAERFFTPKENEYIKEFQNETDRRFFEIWTKKEAYIKKNSLAIKDLNKADANNIYTVQRDGYIISLCSDDTQNAEIISTTHKELMIILENNGYL